MQEPPSHPEVIRLRTDLRPGDVGTIVWMHGILYAREQGFDATFEAYVAGPLATFVMTGSGRDRLWLAERDNRIVGCVAIVGAGPTTAQLRWFLVDPAVRGMGLGKRLLDEALAFATGQGYHQVFLWTVQALETAAHLYRKAGFQDVEEKPGRLWGVEVIEQRYEHSLGSTPS